MATKKRKCSFSWPKDWDRTYSWVRPIKLRG